MNEKAVGKNFKLDIPLDASKIEDFKPDQPVKVAVQDSKGSIQSQIVKLNEKGLGTAAITYAKSPGSLHVMVGPHDAADSEMPGLQTITRDVPARLWLNNNALKLPPIVIPPFHWHWWRVWCRTFVIQGRVLCPDGSPVPGAKVCAYDVDWWWWWISRQLIGCDTTDATGSFEIKFRWCCGWWPWWWWRIRYWQLEPLLVDKIIPILQQEPRIPIPRPDPVPDLSIFNQLLGSEGKTIKPLTRKADFMPQISSAKRGADDGLFQKALVDPELLAGLRERLLAKLPLAPAMERLCIWPWWPWFPWRDCVPDVIFHVTQDCEGEEKVIVNETFFDTRWNIANPLSVTLYANDEACCIPSDNSPEGECIILTHACDDQVNNIGGNPGAPAAPVGYVNPGLATIYGDRPYSGSIPISGLFGNAVDLDYYEFEWTQTPLIPGSWSPMPPLAAGGVRRWYWGNRLGGGPVDFHYIDFPFVSISGRNVIESRLHFETHNEPLSWGHTRWWTSNRDLLMYWRSQNVFSDGTYHLRVRSWKINAGGNLVNPQILPLCLTQKDNGIALTIDNRTETGGPFDINGHRCGAGTVHRCTGEPDTAFLAVKIIHADGTESDVGVCGTFPIADGDDLQVDFVAYDPDGHLSFYTLQANYDVSLSTDLLSLGGTLLPSPVPVAWAPAAAQAGPRYGDPIPAKSALSQGALAPIWHGGAIRLRVRAKDAFPETCCYQLELWAHKRTIVNCDDSLWGHTNHSEYGFMITV